VKFQLMFATVDKFELDSVRAARVCVEVAMCQFEHAAEKREIFLIKKFFFCSSRDLCCF
jgi:hypothetical protein